MSNTVVDQVVVDGLAVLKIVKHCREGLPNLVSGALLGLDQRGVLEITHSFPGISTASADGGPAAEANAEDDQQYQLDMMTSLREVNVDNNRVGGYQSMFYGNFNNFQIVEALQQYHENIPNSIVLLYDPIQTANGSLTLRAFRLSDKFLNLSKRGDAGSIDFIPPSEILEELPIKIRNPGLINALLFDMKRNASLSCDFERLDLSTNPYLEKNLEYLCGWVDDLSEEQYKYKNVLQPKRADDWRRKQGDFDNKEAPDRLLSLLLSNQISQYCSQIHEFTGRSFGKLFLAGSMQRSIQDS